MADTPSKQPFRFRGFQAPNYTQVPDELFDELLTVLSGAELKVTLYIIRRTFGFKKQSDNIALSQMLRGITTRDGRKLDHGVGLHKSTLLQVLRDLTDKGVIIATRRESAERGHEATNYMLNLIGVQSSPQPPDDNQEGPRGGGSKDGTPLVGKSDQGRSENPTKGLVGKSAPQETVNQETVKVVNALPTNDLKKPLERGKSAPAISDRALRAKYGLTDEQLGQVHYLVERQVSLLGSVERNHAHYVKRAAEAVAAGEGQILDAKLGDFKQASTSLTVGLAPAYFHTMWKEETDRRRRQVAVKTPAEKIGRGASPAAADDRITRMIADAESRKVRVPEHIRQSTNYQQVARWWASLDASET
jgi:hypothetical protein